MKFPRSVPSMQRRETMLYDDGAALAATIVDATHDGDQAIAEL